MNETRKETLNRYAKLLSKIPIPLREIEVHDVVVLSKLTLINANNKEYLLIDGNFIKIVLGQDYNYVFSKITGDFCRWGKNTKDDPEFSPVGPEIWDCEYTTSCQGVPDKKGVVSPCVFCYKSNTSNGRNLSFENFRNMIDAFPKTLTQIAFGGDSTATSNPDLWKMMAYCKSIGIVPNITVANINNEVADKLELYCGAVAVSRYENKNICYNSIQKLATNRKMRQINIHAMLSEQTFERCMETVKDMATDKRLKNMNAIVFLGLKKQGRARQNFNTVPFSKFEELITFCLNNDINFGFDSCSACRFEKVVRESGSINNNDKKRLIESSESCESGAFSFYTSINSEYFPCSFTEGEKGWKKGINMLNISNFLTDIWYNSKNIDWRTRLINSKKNGCRKCLSFPEINI